MNAFEVTTENFNAEVLNSNVPVLVDFWAVWCGPCKAIAPVVEEVAKDFQGTLKVGKLDVDTHPDVSGKYGVRSIPTLMLFNKGQVVGQRLGAVNKQALVSWIQSLI